MNGSKVVFQFTNDLRLRDNPAFARANQQASKLLCVYVWDQRLFKGDRFSCQRIGEHRSAFISQALQDLDAQLRNQGQRLLVIEGQDSVRALHQIVGETQAELVVRSAQHCHYEQQDWFTLQSILPNVVWQEHSSNILFEQTQFDFTLEQLPDTFTQFRKRVEKLQIAAPQAEPSHLAALLSSEKPVTDTLLTAKQATLTGSHNKNRFAGGEQAAHQHLSEYFSSEAPSTYKLTRNALDNWPDSSKLSPWLAAGNLSPRQVISAIRYYESLHGANESTYWLYFELLWREYFQWYAKAKVKRLFLFQGLKASPPLISFYPQRFIQWCQGQTAYPIVNACMKQLNATGYMSNRGRQLVASCLVNELQLDWRAGAAYFEQQLIDYDAASNWGNWQYLAGVGADPRGSRRFNLDKQTQFYDPEHEFINRWSGHETSSLNSETDAADWPVS